MPVPPIAPEVFKASGAIRTHLVNGHGDVDGLILSNGEQVRFSPKVGELVVAAEQGASAQVSIEGNGVLMSGKITIATSAFLMIAFCSLR